MSAPCPSPDRDRGSLTATGHPTLPIPSRPSAPSRALVAAALGWLTLVAPAPAEEPLAVTAVTARTETPTARSTLIGEITAPETLQASFPLGGRLTAVRAQVGDHVLKGDELARIEQVQQAQALRAAEAQLSAAEAEHAAAQSAAQRQAQLFERGATTRSDRDSAADRFAAAVALKTQAEATLDQAKQALEDTVLTAPADATVTDRFGEPGQVVGAAQPVLELAVGQGFEATFNVPETVLTASRAAPAEVELSAIDRPGLTVTARVKEISPLVDPARGTVEATVALEENLPGLTYGDPVRGSTTWQDEPGISLPWSAISSGVEGPSVWVVSPEDNTVSERPITIARYSEHRILVEEGIAEGETVVTRGAQLLFPGRKVRIVEAPE